MPVPAALAFDVWRDQARYPEWMDHITAVRPGPDKTTHWTMRRLDGGVATWRAEVTLDRPPHLFAWGSDEGDLTTGGRVEIEDAPKGCRVQVRRFHVAARGQDLDLVARRFGDPQAKLREDMEGFMRQLRKVQAERRLGERAARAVVPR